MSVQCEPSHNCDSVEHRRLLTGGQVVWTLPPVNKRDRKESILWRENLSRATSCQLTPSLRTARVKRWDWLQPGEQLQGSPSDLQEATQFTAVWFNVAPRCSLVSRVIYSSCTFRDLDTSFPTMLCANCASKRQQSAIASYQTLYYHRTQYQCDLCTLQRAGASQHGT